MGWTVDNATDLTNANVNVTPNGTTNSLPVTVSIQSDSSKSIKFVPVGWSVQPGNSYRVVVSSAAPTIEYTVIVVDCG
jgi:hypothetical protein